MKFKAFLSVVIIALYATATNAQNNTSPYSILGVGDIQSGYYGRWSGMGNAGVALSSNRYLNQANIASLSKLDDQFFVMEVSGRYKYTTYTTQSTVLNGTHSADLSMEKLALGLKLSKRWGTGIGLDPFSTSNYSFNSKKTILGTSYQTDVYNQGSGGLNQVYWANSYQVIKNLSIGIKAGYLFGSLNQKEEMSSLISDVPIITASNIYMRKGYLTYALQYGGKISKKWQVQLGATYAAKTKLNSEYTIGVTQNDSAILKEEVVKNDQFTIPQTYTAGVAVTYNNKLTLALDYRSQGWSSLNYRGLNYQLINSSKYSFGFEYAKKTAAFGTLLERSFFQGGFFYNKSYLQVNNEQLNDQGFTLGFGANSKRNSLGYQVGLEIGTRGTTNKGLIKENYSQLMFTISYRDFWFTKGRKYD